MSLGDRLKKLRVAKGYPTARDFAAVLGINENRYCRYERGDNKPKLALLEAICQKLGTTPNELYGWEPGTSVDALPASGFADSGRDFSSPPSEAAGESVSPASDAAALALDLAGWRLASVLARALTTTKCGEVRELDSMRSAAEIFTQLKADPFGTLARSLQTPDLRTAPPELERLIAAEIQSFLAALEAGGGAAGSEARARD